MRPAPLPDQLPAAFTVAEAFVHGVACKRLRAKDLSSPFHGTRAREALADAERLRLLFDAVPAHAFVCGITAAAVWRLPLPTVVDTDAWATPRIGVPQHETRVRRDGVVGHRLAVDDGDIRFESGVALLSPARTWIDVSRTLTPSHLLALTDALISRRRPMASIAELADMHERFRGGRGSRARERSLELADEGAESPRESMLRLILIDAGLPAPECNVEIWDGPRFVARVDMLYRDLGLIIEYDGDHHRDPDQWSRDQIRRAELEALGYRYTTVTRRDFDDPEALVRRIRRMLAAA
ncbi:endonuclease domain-containing protein [Microbacterium sp. SSW1-49]|uniref:Endonuclease domain-containing protein n=1 Tax=Microbacterium croceum TaxID=2851645 RepID=A0ABT0FHZ1_9MICO|nr:endonuclease domain-containing protein [Microbacterium croceum]MCK2037673.1 endonuclease domain-containing protein [Microbacterium croceum]